MKLLLATSSFLFLFVANAQNGKIPVPARDCDSTVSIFDSVHRITFVELHPTPFVRETPRRFLKPAERYVAVLYESIIRGDSINTNYIRCYKNLPVEQWKDLKTVLNDRSDNDYTSTSCYVPRNAILFYNQNERVIAYLEICFQCSRYETRGAPLFDPELKLSVAQYKQLKGLFEANDVRTNLSVILPPEK